MGTRRAAWWVQPAAALRPGSVVVFRVAPEHPLQVPRVEDQQPIEALPAHRPYPALREGIGPTPQAATGDGKGSYLVPPRLPRGYGRSARPSGDPLGRVFRDGWRAAPRPAGPYWGAQRLLSALYLLAIAVWSSWMPFLNRSSTWGLISCMAALADASPTRILSRAGVMKLVIASEKRGFSSGRS